MKIRTFKRLRDGVYGVAVHTEAWSEGDQALMTRFGEPQIDVGGTITEYVSLDSQLKRVMTESPFSAKFDSRDDAAAMQSANAWADEIAARIQEAVLDLRQNVDGFSGETLTELV